MLWDVSCFSLFYNALHNTHTFIVICYSTLQLPHSCFCPQKRDPRVAAARFEKEAEAKRLFDKITERKAELEARKKRLREAARQNELRRWEELERNKDVAAAAADVEGTASSEGERVASSNKETKKTSTPKNSVVFLCEACNKMFKSEAQFNVHERSRKHVLAVAELVRRLEEESEEEATGSIKNKGRIKSDNLEAGLTRMAETDEKDKEDLEDFKIEGTSEVEGLDVEGSESDLLRDKLEEPEEELSANDVQSDSSENLNDFNNNRSGNSRQTVDTSVADEMPTNEASAESECEDSEATTSQQNAGDALSEGSADSDSDAEILDRLRNLRINRNRRNASLSDEGEGLAESAQKEDEVKNRQALQSNSDNEKNINNEASSRRNKKKKGNNARNVTAPQGKEGASTQPIKENQQLTNKGKKKMKQQPEAGLVCLVCQSEFPSANRLFRHIKETNHAVVKDVAVTQKGKNKR